MKICVTQESNKQSWNTARDVILLPHEPELEALPLENHATQKSL